MSPATTGGGGATSRGQVLSSLPWWLKLTIAIALLLAVFLAIRAGLGGIKEWLAARKREKQEAEQEAEYERLAQERKRRRDAGLPDPTPTKPGEALKADLGERKIELNLATCATCQSDQPLWGLSIFKPPSHWAEFNSRCAPVQKECHKAGVSYNVWTVDKLIPPG